VNGGLGSSKAQDQRPKTKNMQTVSDHRKLSKISRMDKRGTRTFREASPDVKRLVLERLLDDITADKLKAAVAEVKTNETRRSV